MRPSPSACQPPSECFAEHQCYPRPCQHGRPVWHLVTPSGSPSDEEHDGRNPADDTSEEHGKQRGPLRLESGHHPQQQGQLHVSEAEAPSGDQVDHEECCEVTQPTEGSGDQPIGSALDEGACDEERPGEGSGGIQDPVGDQLVIDVGDEENDRRACNDDLGGQEGELAAGDDPGRGEQRPAGTPDPRFACPNPMTLCTGDGEGPPPGLTHFTPRQGAVERTADAGADTQMME